MAFALLFTGAILAFALNDPDASFLGFEPRSVGLVLLFAGTVLAGVAAIVSVDPFHRDSGKGQSATGGSVNTENLRAITGLIAVVSALVAVAALTVVTVQVLVGEQNEESVVAVTTSAFGIVSAVVTAFLGIKATANAAAMNEDKAEKATEARVRAEVSKEHHEALVAAVDALPEEQANAIKANALSQNPKPDPPTPPAKGG
ncbi:MAG: hypothetical protein ACTHKT_01505 [Solirubrobacterales bacterium]